MGYCQYLLEVGSVMMSVKGVLGSQLGLTNASADCNDNIYLPYNQPCNLKAS